MGANVDPLVISRVIGDVVDMFVPTVSMSVHYGAKHVHNGCRITPSITASVPRVTITGDADHLYTLVMTDPDAPSPSEPSMREWIHWIVTNIPGCSNAACGKEVVTYLGPRPTVGIHRYIFVLFRQTSSIEAEEAVPASRLNFNTRDLGVPVATVYFNAQKETKRDRA